MVRNLLSNFKELKSYIWDLVEQSIKSIIPYSPYLLTLIHISLDGAGAEEQNCSKGRVHIGPFLGSSHNLINAYSPSLGDFYTSYCTAFITVCRVFF